MHIRAGPPPIHVQQKGPRFFCYICCKLILKPCSVTGQRSMSNRLRESVMIVESGIGASVRIVGCKCVQMNYLFAELPNIHMN